MGYSINNLYISSDFFQTYINCYFFIKKNFSFIFSSIIILLLFLIRKNNFIKINTRNSIALLIYENINFYIMVFLILYLLLTLICVVKLIKFEYGPLIKRL